MFGGTIHRDAALLESQLLLTGSDTKRLPESAAIPMISMMTRERLGPFRFAAVEVKKLCTEAGREGDFRRLLLGVMPGPIAESLQ